jgi:AcrR family transcriptional regulator
VSFAGKGFAGTTIRGVAAQAGVDAALVHHYFGTKDDLFLAAMELPFDPRGAIGAAMAGGRDGAGERLIRVFLSVWDNPEIRPVLVGRMRTEIESGDGGLVTGFLPVVLEPAAVALGLDRPRERMAFVASQMVGLILTRYVFALEPLASMSTDALLAAYAPVIQHYLTGDLSLTGDQAVPGPGEFDRATQWGHNSTHDE